MSPEIVQMPRQMSDYCLNNNTSKLSLKVLKLRALTVSYQRRNATLLVNRCPAEILEEIFLYVRDSSLYDYLEADDSSLPSVANAYRWLRIIRVCRRWKDVAFASSALWSMIVCGHIKNETICSFLSRSRNVALKVSISESSLFPPSLALKQKSCQFLQSEHHNAVAFKLCQIMALLSPHFHRITTFRYHSNHLPEHFQSIFSTAAPRLRVLNVGSSTSQFPPDVLPQIFSGDLSSVHTLKLTAIPSWPAVTYPGLRSLILHKQSLSDPIFVQRLYTTLARNPHIQHIELVGDGDPEGGTLGWHPISFIQLNHLETLTMISHPPDLISSFLSFLIISANATIIINHEDAVYDIGGFLPTDVCHLPGVQIATEMAVKYGQDACDLTLRAPSSRRPTLIARGHLNFEDIELETFGDIYDLSTLRHLSLESDNFFSKCSPEFWGWALKNMTSLLSIRLENVTPHTLMQVILNSPGYSLPEFDVDSHEKYCTDESHNGCTVVHSLHSFRVKFGGVPVHVEIAYECRPSDVGMELVKTGSLYNEKHLRTILTRKFKIG